jgi:4-amino-4-deoxy-L-arabinose transferase-like glycosyltransferase
MGTEKQRLYKWGAVIILIWLLFAQALGAARAASITFDEGPHLAVGYATLRTGDMRLQPVHIHPPLANLLAAAPLLLNPDLPDPREVPGWEIASLSAVTDAVVWQSAHPASLALAGRLPIIFLTLLTGVLVFRWATDLAGLGAGFLALVLYTLDPNIIAHGSLVTTDMAVTALGLLAFFLLFRFYRVPTRLRLLGVGTALGLVLASKVSAGLILLLVEAILVLRRGRWDWKRRLGFGLFVGLVAFLVLWGVYRFEVRPLPAVTGSIPLPAATHLDIYRSLQEHYHLGHPAFLMGQNGIRGWWLYFPVAFVAKTPLPTLILLGTALVVFVKRRQPIDLALVLYPLVYLVTALFSSVDIGYRHLLPVLPFLYIFIAAQLFNAGFVSQASALWTMETRAIAPRSIFAARFLLIAQAVAVGFLVLWLAVGTSSISPYPLTFFNELVGGPDGGYRWLVDSNLDWGQNLWQLRDWMQAEDVRRVYYSHFSPARPEVYGVAADWLPPDPRAASFAPFDPAPGVYAIGATTLQGVYTPDVNTFAYFDSREPDAVLGHAMFIYRVLEHSAPDWVAVCLGLPLSDQQVRAGFGQPGLRLIFYDCSQSQIYPLGGEGRYVLPPQTDWPERATLELQSRHADGQPAYAIVRAGERPSPETPLEAASLNGPLDFLGYQLDNTQARQGDEVTLWTYWQVKEVPNRPLSLMAHMLGPDGVLVAVGDGMGVPVESWQPGDVIVQRHRFAVPEGASPGEYWLQAGAYWLDTMERWPLQDPMGSSSDQLDLTTVEVLD